MAVAVLERDVNTLEKIEEERKVGGFNAQMSADEQHNAQISERYAKLISSNNNVDEILGRSQQAVESKPRNELFAKPYLVENARADAEIFRADSPVNRKALDMQPVMSAEDSEEENEDLRPTSTTIQYKTYGVKKAVEENTNAEKRAGLSKKEKIVIAAVVSIIVVMLVLIIVNSAVISGINADLGSLQSSLEVVKGSYAGISDEISNISNDALENATEFAIAVGMVKN